MRREIKMFICLASFVVAGTSYAQTVISHPDVKVTSKYNNVLYLNPEDSTYNMRFRSSNRFMENIVVELGSQEDAVKILSFLTNYEGQTKDVVSLDNESHNCAIYKKGDGFVVENWVFTNESITNHSVLVPVSVMKHFLKQINKSN